MTDILTSVKVGTKGAFHIGSDTYPVTVVGVFRNGRSLKCRFEKFVGDEGHEYFGQQKWKITENPEGRVELFTWHPSAQRYRQGGCGCLNLNGWHAHQDPSF